MSLPFQHLIDKHRASLDAAKGIPTWTCEDELAWLAEEASKRQDILEIGTYKGHSAKVMAHATKGVVHCWDKCPDDGVEEAARRNLKSEIVAGRVYLEHGDAGATAARWAFVGFKQFDMIFIDDGHTYADVVRDCCIAMLHIRRMQPGPEPSLICGHDYEKPFNEVARAVNDCFWIMQTP